MKVEIKVPLMGESVAEAIVSNLIAGTGSQVEKDQEIIELETDKVNQVLYAPEKGSITWNVKVNDVVKIGQVIGSVDTDVKGTQEVKPAPQALSPAVEKKGPSSRKMAVDFVQEIKTPVPKANKPETPVNPAPQKKVFREGTVTRKRMSGMRRVIAQKLVEAKNTTAMLTTFNEIDMSTVMEIRAKEQDGFVKKYGVKLGFMSFFVKAVVAALKEFEQINSMIDEEEIVTFKTFDIGVAIGVEKGLFVPVIKDCEKLSFGQIEKQIQEYALKAKEGKIAVEDLKGGSFTITNGGTFGSLLSTPIINIPQSAILGMHSITKRAVVVNDQIVIRPMMYVALTYDHRLIDGREAVLFLVHLKKNLEEPARLLLDL